MERTISTNLRTIFLVHMIIALVLGAALWLIPGRTLTLLGWLPEMVQLPESQLSVPGTTFMDSLLTRLLGAALLALAYSSFRGWRAERWEQVSIIVKTEFFFCAAGALSTFVELFQMERDVPIIGWVIAALLLIFAILWGWDWSRKAQEPQ